MVGQSWVLMGSFFRYILLGLVLVAGASAGAWQEPQVTAPHHEPGVRLSARGIPNFAQVSANLYRGGQPNAEGIQRLKSLGIDIVVDMRRGENQAEQKQVTDLGMKYVGIPSRCPFPTDEPWARFLKVMRENPGKKIFVHCRLGDDRTGMAVAAYRMSEQAWSADEALREMKAFGFSPLHQAICPGLEGYVADFPRHMKEGSAFRELASPAETTPSK